MVDKYDVSLSMTLSMFDLIHMIFMLVVPYDLIHMIFIAHLRWESRAFYIIVILQIIATTASDV